MFNVVNLVMMSEWSHEESRYLPQEIGRTWGSDTEVASIDAPQID